MRTCRKCGVARVATRAGVATCTDCQPRKNSKYRLRPHRRTIVQRGSEHGRAVLTEQQVLDIITACRAGTSVTALARQYGVNAGTIGHIKMGRTWTHLQPVAAD